MSKRPALSRMRSGLTTHREDELGGDDQALHEGGLVDEPCAAGSWGPVSYVSQTEYRAVPIRIGVTLTSRTQIRLSLTLLALWEHSA